MTPCDRVVRFVDGELSDVEAAAFREHLKQCDRCRIAVVEAMQLSARLSEARR